MSSFAFVLRAQHVGRRYSFSIRYAMTKYSHTHTIAQRKTYEYGCSVVETILMKSLLMTFRYVNSIRTPFNGVDVSISFGYFTMTMAFAPLIQILDHFWFFMNSNYVYAMHMFSVFRVSINNLFA